MNNHKIKSIFFDILLTVVTGGLFNIWVQYRQIRDLNQIIQIEKKKYPGRSSLKTLKEHSFLFMILLSFITLGLFFIWHEYQMTKTIHLLTIQKSEPLIEILAVIGTVCALWFLVDSYQQDKINDYWVNF